MPSLVCALQIAGVVAMFRYPADTALAVGINLSQVRLHPPCIRSRCGHSLGSLQQPQLMPGCLAAGCEPLWPCSSWGHQRPSRPPMHPDLFPMQIGEFVFVLLSVASQQELIDQHVYLLLMGAALCCALPCWLRWEWAGLASSVC